MAELTILDGGMSRELVRLGAELRQPEWSALALLESPDIVRQVHAEFIDAGARVITTNSYALVPFHIGEERFNEDGARLIALSGQLARAAADSRPDRKALVAGSLPPIFGSYKPELFRAEEIQRYLSVFVEALSPFVDLWIGETLSLTAEGAAVLEAVAGGVKPVWLSFTLRDDAQNLARGECPLRGGESVREAALWTASAAPDALLFNCSQPEAIKRAIEISAETLREAGVAIPLGAYANAFAGDTNTNNANEAIHGLREDLHLEGYLTFAQEWVDAGATLVGGCCGIGVEHIRKLSERLSPRGG